MSTSIAIVTYNSAAEILRCLASLPDRRVFVIDNASTDNTADAIALGAPNVRVIRRNRNGGFAAAVNEGLALAAPDDVLILNPDVILELGSLDVLERYLQRNSRVGIVSPRLLDPTGSIQSSVRTFPSLATMAARRLGLGRTAWGRQVLRRHLAVAVDGDNSRAVDWVLGAAMLVRREAINHVGLMDPRFFLYGEDVDWCYRMWLAGWEIHYVPEGRMTHTYARASRATFNLRSAATRHHWASVAKLFARHPRLLLGLGPGGSRR